jgi:uncharacterized repeat protein (TIGR02543 family)
MKKSLLKQIFCICGIFALAVLFTTCVEELKNQEDQNKAVVSFSVMENMARTVFPQVALADVASYKLFGGRNGAQETELLEFTTGSTSLTLEPGTWNFTLNAYNEDGDHILQGKVLNQQINLTGTNSVSFTLAPLNSGTGNVLITLNFPEEAGITRISTSGDFTSEEFTNFSNGNFVYSKSDIAAGDHFINFNLYRDEMLRTTVSELVLVRNNLTSSKIITLVGENLKPMPTYEIEINFTGLNEWELLEQNATANPNENMAFAVSGTYTSYEWFLDGISVGTSSSYIFNRPTGVYQLVLVVTNSAGESRSGRCRITVGVAPAIIFGEDFEGVTHSFTLVPSTGTSPVNQWRVGTAVAAPGGGSRSAYISNNNGTSNAYTITSTSVVHMHRDVTFPTSSVPYTLSFDWRAQGENNFDFFTVRLVETSTSITAGTQLTTGTLLGTYSMGGATAWNKANISIPASNSGTTRRLVFSWVNNASGGTQPPAAVDNILLTADPSTTYTVAFGVNNGTGTVPVAQTVNIGSSIILPSGSGLSRSGFTFGGWNTNTAGSGTNYTAGSAFTPTSNITLHVRWLGTATVTFNANSGTGTVPVAQTVNTGSSITLPSGSGLTRSGFAFSGWNTQANGLGVNYNASTPFTPEGNITLFARWTAAGITLTQSSPSATVNVTAGVNGRVPVTVTAPSTGSVTLVGQSTFNDIALYSGQGVATLLAIHNNFTYTIPAGQTQTVFAGTTGNVARSYTITATFN